MATYEPPRRAKRVALDRIERAMREDSRWTKLAASARFVPGTGFLDAQIAIVGEAPGATEDEQGLPFVGEAGAKLDELLVHIGLARRDLWITNVVKYRPPDNRNPRFDEASAGRYWLRRELDVISPLLVILCGRFALRAIQPGASIRREHGEPFSTTQRSYFPAYHPAACLRDGVTEDETFRDFEQIPGLLASLTLAAELTGTDP